MRSDLKKENFYWVPEVIDRQGMAPVFDRKASFYFPEVFTVIPGTLWILEEVSWKTENTSMVFQERSGSIPEVSPDNSVRYEIIPGHIFEDTIDSEMLEEASDEPVNIPVVLQELTGNSPKEPCNPQENSSNVLKHFFIAQKVLKLFGIVLNDLS